MAKVKPSIRPTETYTEANFLRVYTAGQSESHGQRVATIEQRDVARSEPAQQFGEAGPERRRIAPERREHLAFEECRQRGIDLQSASLDPLAHVRLLFPNRLTRPYAGWRAGV